jgi:transposase
MLKRQVELKLSPYMALYDILVEPTHKLRLLKGLIDFEFIYKELESKYCLVDGRTAVDPVLMFKLLLLKKLYPQSDRSLVDAAHKNMAFKYFLDLAPEDDLIHPSLLAKFRRQRLQDVELLDLLIEESTRIALEKGLIKSKDLILDATHTQACFSQKSPIEFLRSRSKQLRKSIYALDETLKEYLPVKYTGSAFDEELAYAKELATIVRYSPKIKHTPTISEKLEYLDEGIQDCLTMSKYSEDPDAKVGHKTVDNAFFGYKTHLAMTGDRMIVSAVVTSGNANDGKQLPQLIEKANQNKVEYTHVIADAAYSPKENIDFLQEQNKQLVAPLHPVVYGANRKKGFEYNKDSGMYVCPAGYESTKVWKNKRDDGRLSFLYFFDIEKCKTCPFKEDCYKEGAKTKTYKVTEETVTHSEYKKYIETQEYDEKRKTRYKIEAKNAELKHAHGLKIASSKGLFGMQIDAATSIFVANIKRIMTLLEEEKGKE